MHNRKTCKCASCVPNVYVSANGKQPLNNPISLWLALIGTAENAKKLRFRLDTLKAPVLDPTFGPEPIQCPTTILYGMKMSQMLYACGLTRPALDAWDSGQITSDDLRRFCLLIERGQSHADGQEALLAIARSYTRTQRIWESLKSNDREQRLASLGIVLDS